ncbi:MAG: hypothetical protein RL235_897 [Chlamydiota bacterium]|jgi:SET domain-containing protein
MTQIFVENTLLSVEEFEAKTKARFIPSLIVLRPQDETTIRSKIAALHKKGELTKSQLWRGHYYQAEINRPPMPDVYLRWIDPILGWGVFARRAFKKWEYISEYTGILRKRRWRDRKNSYCFEYIYVSGEKTPFTIDAEEQGGISRYINHSQNPNLTSMLATLDNFSHILLVAARDIAPHEQLTYDYGPLYWAKREKPIEI